MNQIHLSVVATSRNDDHGENLRYRMQYFVDGFVEQCKRHHLNAELILVEWNPPEHKAPLSQALVYPEDLGPCTIRIIRVPKELHEKFAQSDRLPLFQMIAKNVGIRRARGKFVLATNIDILFSDALIKDLRTRLDPHFFYRVNRLDIPADIPKFSSFDDTLKYCRCEFFRVNGRYGTKVKIEKKWILTDGFFAARKSFSLLLKLININFIFSKNNIKNITKIIKIKEIKLFFKAKLSHRKRLFYVILQKIRSKFYYQLHTNACGDFTLFSYENWMKLKGYPEWPIYSWHIDSLLLYQAKLSGLQQKVLSPKKAIYHIEHGKGSGYSPEAANLLFKRLKDNKIPYITNAKLAKLIREMEKKKKANQDFSMNNEQWGLANHELEEVCFSTRLN